MTRLCSISIHAALAVGLVACGSSSPSDSTPSKGALDIVPGDGTVSDWKIDLSQNANANGAPMTGATKPEVERYIDGAATPFFLDPYKPKLWAWQNYTNKNVAAAPEGAEVSMYVLQMPTAADAGGLYTAVLKLSEYARKEGTEDDWKSTDLVSGAEARIEDTGSGWWINFHKDVFYVEIVLTPSTGPSPDFLPHNADTKKEAIRFAKEVAGKI